MAKREDEHLERLKFPDDPELRARLEGLCERLGLPFELSPLKLWALIGLALAKGAPEFKPSDGKRGRGRPRGSPKSSKTYFWRVRLAALEARVLVREEGRDKKKVISEIAASLVRNGLAKNIRDCIRSITAAEAALEAEELEQLAADIFSEKRTD